MTKAIQWRRGTTSDHTSFTGLQGEITVDVTKNTLIVHDQSTVSGFPLAREDLSNVSSTDLSNKGLALSDLSNVDMSPFISINATDAEKGIVELATDAETITGTDTTRATTPANVKAAIEATATVSFPKGHIFGLMPSLATDTDHDITISAGETRSADNTTDIILNTALTKQIDATWVAGNDVGGLPTPLTVAADTTYHLFVIYNPTTKITDAGFDTNLNATNLLTAATGYTIYRRIGSFITDANANFLGFNVNENAGGGTTTEYLTPITDANIVNPGLSGNLRTLSVPTGLEVEPIYSATPFQAANAGNLFVLITSPQATDVVPSSTYADAMIEDPGTKSVTINKRIRTNTSGQIRTRFSRSDGWTYDIINTFGYVDNRI